WVVVPVLVFAIVFGLSMDYEVFLLTRVKEVFDKTGRNDHATMEGLSATASTITSAALIMILVFGTFAFARVLAVQLVGFGLAAAVLLDATLIRMVLVPAIMHIAGRWNWWPGVRAPRLEREVDTYGDAEVQRRPVDPRSERGGRPARPPSLRSTQRLGAPAPPSRSNSRRRDPHRSQCHAGTLWPVLGSFSGLYCSHSGRMPSSAPSASRRSLSALTRWTMGSSRSR